jgi:ribonuclease P protein subunit RPR2
MGERRQRRGRRTRDIAAIASERMQILIERAQESSQAGEPALADRYAQLARALGMRYNIRLPPQFKRRLCRDCGSYLVPGRNMRVRLRDGRTVWTCLKCGGIKRRPTVNRPKPPSVTPGPHPVDQKG